MYSHTFISSTFLHCNNIHASLQSHLLSLLSITLDIYPYHLTVPIIKPIKQHIYPSQFVIYILTLNSSTIYYLRISHLKHHKYIPITTSYYNPSYETLSTSSIIHLPNFTYHTAIRYPSYNITYIFHNLDLSRIFNELVSIVIILC